MEPSYTGATLAAERPNTFLAAAESRVQDIKQILYGITERLNAAGFYPQPTAPSKADGTPATESNIRQALDESLTRVYEVSLSIKEQIDRLA